MASRTIEKILTAALVLFALPPPAGAGTRRIEIFIGGAPSDVASLETAILAPLAHLHADVHVTHVERIDPREVVTPTAAPTAPAVRVWFDLESQAHATIYMTDESWDRVLVRRIPLAHGLDEVGREALAFLTGSSVEAMLSGAQIGISREEAKEVIGVDGLPPREGSREAADPRWANRAGLPPTWGLGFSYEAGAFAQAMPFVQGPGISLLLSDQRFRRRAWITGLYRMPGHIETEPVDIQVSSLGVRAGFAFNSHLGRSWWLSGGLGAGIERTRVEPRVNEGLRTVRLTTVTSWDPSLRPTLGVAWAVGQTMLLFEGGADVDLARTQYVVRTDGVGNYVLSPWVIRPMIAMSMLVGSQSFATER